MEPDPHEDLQELLRRRPRGAGPLFRRYIMGRATETLLTKEELRERIGWDNLDDDAHQQILEIMQDELKFTMDGLREQFAKVAGLIALFALMIAFNLSGGAKGKTILVVCIAASIAVWVQSPRGKIFQFRSRPDSGLRIGAITTKFDRVHYLYSWLSRREQTLQAAEVLVFQTTMIAIGALLYVGLIA